MQLYKAFKGYDLFFFFLGKGDMIVIDSLNVKFIFVVVEYKLPTS